jgi:CubicO group peptidase (beta-lactamase class C family)
MLERSAPECTRGRIAFRRAERHPARSPVTRIPHEVHTSFPDPGRAARVRATGPAVDALFAEALGELGAPGLAYGVALDGELLHSGGCGVRDLESGVAPDADTAFRICSMTKSFVAVVVLSLRDEGRLDIDAPLAKLVPDLRALAEAGPDAPPVTVRQLLTMDAGLPQDDPWADRLMAEDNAWVSAEVFARGATRSRAPGTAFEYSNYSWAALGRVVEAVTGQRHQDLVRERVLEPLGLRSTVWSAGDLPSERVATGYRPADDGFTREVPLADGGYFSALGGLYSSVRDLARWSGVFLDAEPPRDAPERAPVSRATLREMSRARSAFAPGVEWPSLAEPPGVIAGGYGYGLMIWHERDGQRHVGHPGGLPGFGTLMRWVPELGLSVILLANVTYAMCERPVRRALELVAREAALPRRAIRLDPGLLAARDAVDGLVRQWDDAAAARLFAPNVDLDRPLAERREELAALAERHGALARDGDVEAEDALRGSWRLQGERGHVELAITMAPTVPPLVETLCVESVLPPSGRLAELAAVAAQLASEPDAAALADLLAPAVDVTEALRALRVAAALYGPFGQPEPVAGDGEKETRLRLPGPRGDVELELELDATIGRLSKLILRPAPAT